MTDHMPPINSTILLKATSILKKRFSTSLKIKSADFLSEPDRRNVVLRLHLESESSGVPNHVILKQSLPEQKDADDKEAYARFARDWAGLEFASSIQQTVHNVPRFYGGNKGHRFILIEDLGQQHISLVDSLTRPNYDNAIAALSRFVKALGSFHASCFGHTALYETMLRKIHPKAETRQECINFAIDELLPILESVNKRLGLPLSTECMSEAKQVIESMLTPGLFTVLTHGDICPDNVFDHEETRDMQLIDFEWALVGNALLDGTYLRMSMPTCWCVKAIPDEVIEPLEIIYREEIKRSIPAASDDVAYARAYTEACGFWLLQQTLPFLDSTIDKDRVGSSGPVPENSLWDPKENWVRPRVLSRLQAFIDVATKQELLPHLRQMAVEVLIAIKKRWPEVKSLEYYPAFRLNTNKLTAISWATAYL